MFGCPRLKRTDTDVLDLTEREREREWCGVGRLAVLSRYTNTVFGLKIILRDKLGQILGLADRRKTRLRRRNLLSLFRFVQ